MKEVEADRLAIERGRLSPARRDQRRAGGTHDNELLSSPRKEGPLGIVRACVCVCDGERGGFGARPDKSVAHSIAPVRPPPHSPRVT